MTDCTRCGKTGLQPDAIHTCTPPHALALADALENPTIQAGALRHTIAAELRRLHAENETLRYEVDAIAAIKEERDALQASLVEAHTTYQAKLFADEALMRRALEALELYVDDVDSNFQRAAITRLKERLK